MVNEATLNPARFWADPDAVWAHLAVVYRVPGCRAVWHCPHDCAHFVVSDADKAVASIVGAWDQGKSIRSPQLATAPRAAEMVTTDCVTDAMGKWPPSHNRHKQ